MCVLSVLCFGGEAPNSCNLCTTKKSCAVPYFWGVELFCTVPGHDRTSNTRRVGLQPISAQEGEEEEEDEEEPRRG